MTEGVVRSSYDNVYTYLHKQVIEFNKPVSQIVAIPIEGRIEYFDLYSVIHYKLDEGIPLIDIYQDLREDNPELRINTLIYDYLLAVNYEEYRDQPEQLINEIQEVYQELDPNNVNLISSFNDMVLLVTRMERMLEDELKNDLIKASRIINIQDRLHELEIKSNSDPNLGFIKTKSSINSVMLTYTPTIRGDGNKVTKIDGYDIFDQAILSPYIPFIQYNDSKGRRYYKVYKGNSMDNEPNYRNTVIPSNRASKSDVIYMTLWLGDPDGTSPETMYRAPKDSFIEVTYNLANNYMTANVQLIVKGVPTNNQQLLDQRVSQGLPLLDLGLQRRVKVRGDFNLIPKYHQLTSDRRLRPPEDGLQFDIYEHILLDLILNDELFSSYIYAEESIKPFPMKQRLDFHYRPLFSDVDEAHTNTSEVYISNSASVSFTIKPIVTTDDEVITIVNQDGKPQRVTMPSDYNYLQIKVYRSESADAIEEFKKVIELLLIEYFYGETDDPTDPDYQVRKLAQLNGMYEELIPNNSITYQIRHQELQESNEKNLKLKRRTGEKVNQLVRNYGEVFGGTYSRKCQSYNQPLALKTEEEAKRWVNKTYTRGGIEYERSYMPYPAPPNETMFYVVCTDDRSPHPGIIPNTTGHNQDKYPYVPCCFPSSQFKSKTNTYAQYYLGLDPEVRDKSGSYIKKTKAILGPDRVGFLPIDIKEILTRSQDQESVIIRYGIPRSKSSLLHAILIAIKHPDYLNANDTEDYVKQLREHIAINVRPELLRQELYDIGLDRIRANLGNSENFLDPALYYRALEEAFDINIYTFAVTDIKENTDSMMEIPRHADFHVRPLRTNRLTVIIYKHLGSESNNLSYPQCELIIDRMNNLDLSDKLFGPSMTRVCHNILTDTLGTVTWKLPEMRAYKNMYNALDMEDILGRSFLSQYVDTNGKTRAVTFPYGSRFITMITPPTQPVNTLHTDEIIPTDIASAMKLMGNQDPTSAIRDRDGNLVGLWFEVLGIPEAILFKIKPVTDDMKEVPNGSPDPVTATGTGTVDRITGLRRTLSIIRQLIYWVFNIYRRSYARNHGLENADQLNKDLAINFFDTYMVVDEVDQDFDSLDYYDFGRLPHRLPLVEGVSEALEHIYQHSHKLVDDDLNLIMYNQDFYWNLRGELLQYYQVNFGDMIEVATEIDNYYQSHRDFTSYTDVEVFVGSNDLEHWISSRLAKNNPLIIKKSVNLRYSILTNPFIYQNQDGLMYLIQNPEDGTINSAATIALNWYENTVNVGPNPVPIESVDLPSRIIYGISPSGQLIAIEDITSGNTNYINLLYYGTENDRLNDGDVRYGAMLPIL